MDEEDDLRAQVIDEPIVAKIASYLAALDMDALRARFDSAAMSRADVYPSSIWDETGACEEYLLPAVQQLGSFFADAARANEVVIASLC